MFSHSSTFVSKVQSSRKNVTGMKVPQQYWRIENIGVSFLHWENAQGVLNMCTTICILQGWRIINKATCNVKALFIKTHQCCQRAVEGAQADLPPNEVENEAYLIYLALVTAGQWSLWVWSKTRQVKDCTLLSTNNRVVLHSELNWKCLGNSNSLP